MGQSDIRHNNENEVKHVACKYHITSQSTCDNHIRNEGKYKQIQNRYSLLPKITLPSPNQKALTLITKKKNTKFNRQQHVKTNKLYCGQEIKQEKYNNYSKLPVVSTAQAI